MPFDVPPSGLPVEDCVPALREALSEAGSAVRVAPPGAGKTTIVPLRLLREPWLAGRRIVVLEPRRLATRAAARRMASLLGEEVGGTVGFTTRDERRVGRATRVEMVTDGVLTRRLQHDPSLPEVGLVVFDEVHERNLQAGSCSTPGPRSCRTCACWPCRPRSRRPGWLRCSGTRRCCRAKAGPTRWWCAGSRVGPRSALTPPRPPPFDVP